MKKATKLKIIRWVTKLLRYDVTKDFQPVIINEAKIQKVRRRQLISHYEIQESLLSEEDFVKMVQKANVEQLMYDLSRSGLIKVTWEDSPISAHKELKLEIHCIDYDNRT